MNALESPKEPLKITSLGQLINLLPVDPRIAKVVAMSSEYGVMKQVCSIVAVMSGDRVFESTSKLESSAWQSFVAREGDLITYLNIFRALKKHSSRKEDFCKQHSLNYRYGKSLHSNYINSTYKLQIFHCAYFYFQGVAVC